MLCSSCFSSRSHNTRRGLTLVEVLLAVAITAVLAAIILPLLARGRELSYQAKCAANLRSFAHAFSLYQQDWAGCWPCPGGLAGDRSYWAQTGNGGLQNYVRQRGVRSIWCCPKLTEWRSGYPARTYSMNSYLRTPCDAEYPTCVGILRGINTIRINEPQRTVLLYEGLPLTTGWEGTSLYEYIYRCANWNYVRGHHDKENHAASPGRPWHGRRNNYLFCDGHIIARQPYRYQGKLEASYDEMYQWYVDKAQFRKRHPLGK